MYLEPKWPLFCLQKKVLSNQNKGKFGSRYLIIFVKSPNLREDFPIWRAYFSKRLKPPTRKQSTFRGDALERLDAILSKLQPTEDTQQALRLSRPMGKKSPSKRNCLLKWRSCWDLFFGCNVLLSLISGWLYQVKIITWDVWTLYIQSLIEYSNYGIISTGAGVLPSTVSVNVGPFLGGPINDFQP